MAFTASFRPLVRSKSLAPPIRIVSRTACSALCVVWVVVLAAFWASAEFRAWLDSETFLALLMGGCAVALIVSEYVLILGCHQFQIVERVISPIMVFVMNNLRIQQWAIKKLLHDVAVLKDAATTRPNHSVSGFVYVTAFVQRMVQSRSSWRSTLSRAKALAAIFTRACTRYERFSAILASLRFHPINYTSVVQLTPYKLAEAF